MGKTSSKEEVIIAQAGNSGSNAQGEANRLSMRDTIEITFGVIMIVAVLWVLYGKCKKKFEKKIRKEMQKSMATIV